MHQLAERATPGAGSSCVPHRFRRHQFQRSAEARIVVFLRPRRWVHSRRVVSEVAAVVSPRFQCDRQVVYNALARLIQSGRLVERYSSGNHQVSCRSNCARQPASTGSEALSSNQAYNRRRSPRGDNFGRAARRRRTDS